MALDTHNPEAIDGLLSEIGDALNSNPASVDDLNRLQNRLDPALAACQELFNQSHMVALDPSLPRDALSKSKQHADTVALDIERLNNAHVLLMKKLDVASTAEKHAAQLQRYQDAKHMRDTVADLITTEYPELSGRFVGMIEQIMKTNDVIDKVNLDLPEGAEPLQRPEGRARGFHDHGSYNAPVSTETMRIVQSSFPDIKPDKGAAWPPVKNYRLGLLELNKIIRIMEIFAMWRAK